MNTPQSPTYRIGDIEVDPAQRCVRKNGSILHPRAKSFDLLVYLIERRGRLVLKQELLDNLWRDTSVTENSLVQCVNEVRKVFDDDARNPRYVKTLAKAGYQFIGPVEEAMPGIEEIRPPEPAPVRRHLARWKWIAIGATCLFALGATIMLTRTPRVPVRRTLAVLPFENQSGTAEFDWFREGLPDMLTVDLSRAPQLNVFSRQQVRAWNGRAEAGSRRGAQTRADVLLVGTFAQIGGKLRVSVQLQDARTRELLAAESLVAEHPEQIANQVDLLALKLAAKLGTPIRASGPGPTQGLSTLMTNNLEAYRSYSLGMEAAQEFRSRDALAWFEKAAQADPDFAMAHARIGYTYAVAMGQAEKGRPYLEQAFQLSNQLTGNNRLQIHAWYALANLDYPGAIRAFRQVISANPFDVEAYQRLAAVLTGEDRAEEAVAVLQQALVADPDEPVTHNLLSAAYSSLGKHAMAITEAERYAALAPGEPNAADTLGYIYQIIERYPEAEAAYRRALALKPDFEIATIHLANVYFQTGRYREAIAQCQRYIQIGSSEFERARGYDCLAGVYLYLRRPLEARRAAGEAVRLAPVTVRFPHALLAAVERKTLDLDLLLHHKPEVNERGRRHTERVALVLAGQRELFAGRSEEAIADFKLALRSRPEYYNLEWDEDCLADAYLQLGRLDDAIAEYQRALTVHPRMGLARYHLATAYDRNGRHNLARAEYRRFLELWPNADGDIPEVMAARAQLAR